jgi:Fic family protein
MVELRKRKRGSTDYYYLEHSFRVNGKIMKKELYLGKKLPKNIDAIRIDFLQKIYNEKWYPLLNKIKANYKKDISSATKSEREKELEIFMINFTYDTQKIEGSTLTLRETANLLQHNITPPNKPSRDVKEAESHSKIFYEMLNYNKDLSLQIILKWHYELLKDTRSDIAGKIRTRQVWIAGSKFLPSSPAEVPALIDEIIRWYNKNKDKVNPVELAALMHLKFVTIHPFIDGNGRISRILMNFILKSNKFPMLNVPYKNRTGYYNALERAQTKKTDTVFILWFFKRYIKEYKQYVT